MKELVEILLQIDSGKTANELVVGGGLILQKLKTPEDLVEEVNRISSKEQRGEALTPGEMVLLSSFKAESTAFLAEYAASLARKDRTLIGTTVTINGEQVIGDAETEEISVRTKRNMEDFLLRIAINWKLDRRV